MCQLFAGQPRDNYESQTRSLRLNGQSTSIRLENTFWRILDKIAETEQLSTPQFISKLHSEVMTLHGEASNFSSLLRCTCLVHAEVSQQQNAPDQQPEAATS
ncbi:aryl-sulfate sulfotransferase [Chromatiales bacterium (ex Bugula neritina AB1)]|nr:aryl-sulfate sulfotransferase [Chromatiales bacterium (ex Bugula neritina AB1)]